MQLTYESLFNKLKSDVISDFSSSLTRYLLFCDVTQRRLVVTDVSEKLIGPISRGWILEDVTVCVETLVTNNQSTLRNIQEARRSQPVTK